MPVKTQKQLNQEKFVNDFLETNLLEKFTWDCDTENRETLLVDNNCEWTVSKLTWHNTVELSVYFSNLEWLLNGDGKKKRPLKEHKQLRTHCHMWIYLNKSAILPLKKDMPKNTIYKNNLIFTDIELKYPTAILPPKK